jgi:exopolysaccharide biosynthesis polyprenyl glycosylphosphotransferase
VNSNGILQKHWFHVALHFATDAFLLFCGFIIAAFLRFGEEADDSLWQHWPALVLGGLALSTVLYIAGLYSTHSDGRGFFERAVILAGCTAFASLIIIGSSYTGSARPLGRGVMLLGASLTFLLAFLHHVFLLHALRTARERVAYIVTSAFDEVETRLFQDLKSRNLELVGVIAAGGHRPGNSVPLLGEVEDLAGIVQRERIQRVLCTSQSLGNATLTSHFCKLRYSGVSVMPLVSLCEEVRQYVPLELVTPEWLLNASGEPHLLYIKKVKRLFDILAAFTGLVLSAPLLVLGALAVKLTSRGPVFYRQVRAGRFGRPFYMTKLRTMHVDAEKDGAQWSQARGRDPRTTLVGAFLRRYRIDEIPQMWEVLRGNMSFVGPRPERVEFIDKLAGLIPHYRERLMIQPGITGWAQVNYPYGASVEDARHKLEYDLYYMKHMSLFLDVFILLDTIRIILTGGATNPRSHESTTALAEWQRAKAAHEPPTPHTPTEPLRPAKLETA